MFLETMNNVKRVRSNNLPHGPVYRTAFLGGWITEGPSPSWYVAPWRPYDQDGVFLHDSTLQGYEKSVTGDVPRKYRDKRRYGVVEGMPHLSLWQYIPFYRHKFRVDYENVAPPIQGKRLPCQPSDIPRTYIYCTSENEWISRCPDKLPLVDEGVLYHAQPVDPIELGPEELLARADRINLSLLAKRGIAALESALSNFPDMLVVLGELRELPDLLKLPNSVGDVYLNNQFGIVPTVSSLKDVIIGAIHRWNDAFSPKKLIVRQYEKGAPSVTEGDIPFKQECCWGGPEPCKSGFRDKTVIEESMRFTLELIYQFRPPDVGLAILNKLTTMLSQLNLLGDASSIWELTHLSWLVDWFIDIGLLLKALSILTGTGKWAGLALLDGYVAAQVVREEKRIGAWLGCQYGHSVIRIREEAYGRSPLQDPLVWLTNTAMMPAFRLPQKLSQMLIMAAMLSK